MNNAPDYIKGSIEALLFINEKPISAEQIKEVLPEISMGEIRKIIKELIDEYESARRGVVVVEIAGGYQMLSSPHYANTIRNFFKTRVKEKLSGPSLETLAIVAYKQPVSRGDIELIRGVNSDGVVTNLSDKGLIKITGRKDVPGRPYIYGTTKLFLEYFGLKSLQDLPKLEDFPTLIPKAEEGVEVEETLPEENEEISKEAGEEVSVEKESAQGESKKADLSEDAQEEKV